MLALELLNTQTFQLGSRFSQTAIEFCGSSCAKKDSIKAAPSQVRISIDTLYRESIKENENFSARNDAENDPGLSYGTQSGKLISRKQSLVKY